MLKKTNEWAYSLNGENYGYPFDCKEDAIDEAQKEAKVYGSQSFFIGQVERYVPRINLAESLIDELQEQAWDEIGEYSDGYLEYVHQNEMNELNKALGEAFCSWIEKYPRHEPWFFLVPEAEEYPVNEED